MAWIRHDYNTKNIKGLLGLMAVFFFLTVVFMQFAAAAVLAFIVVVISLQLVYFQHVGNKLEFRNAKSRRRVLNGGETFWELEFENKGLPIWGGKLKISFHDAVEPLGHFVSNYTETVEMDVPFTIGLNQKIIVRVPVTGKKRGLSRTTDGINNPASFCRWKCGA